MTGLDGYVSWEVDPTLAYDRDGTIAEAHRLHDWIDKPNLYVKIPATEPGLGAIEEMIASGKSINVTLIFSLERHKEVMEAYVRGLERLVESGGDPKQVHSVASFFVSRVDTETDKRLDALGGDATKLKGKLAIANAKLAYQNYLEVFAGPRWEALEAKGATKQRCLWASTSTKNPDYRDVMYVEELIGPETVNTMPEETIRAFQDHGKVELTLTKDVEAARKLFEDLAAAGIDYDDVSDTLEREGVQKFSDSFHELLGGISAKRGALATGVTVATQQELVERIWARDATVWTGADEDKWLGWLDEPKRMQERAGEISEFAAEARKKFDDVRPARHGRLLARARGAEANLRGQAAPRPRHHASRDDPACGEVSGSEQDDVHRLVEVRRHTRDAVALRVFLGEGRRKRRTVRCDHRSGLRARTVGEDAQHARLRR